MSDFSRPEYASYVVLCRGLGKEWPCQLIGAHGEYRVPDPCPLCDDSGFEYPALSDWLEMLQEDDHPRAGWNHISFRWYKEQARYWWEANTLTAMNQPLWTGVGPTREEAAARLWMAVRKPAPSLK